MGEDEIPDITDEEGDTALDSKSLTTVNLLGSAIVSLRPILEEVGIEYEEVDKTE